MFSVTLDHWAGGLQTQMATARGYVDVNLTMDRDPSTNELIIVSGMATGGSWSINNLLYHYEVFIPETGETDIYEVPVVGLCGDVWSGARSVVTNGTFPAADHGVTLNDGAFEEWVNGEFLLSSWDFGESPVRWGLDSGEGTISLTGTTDACEIAASLPIDVTIPIFASFVRITGVGTATFGGTLTPDSADTR